jgi:hypothetical protein
VGAVVCSSGWDGAPVLARLCCFGCSLSDGERERERFLLESDSGIAGRVFLVQGSVKIQIWCGERRPVGNGKSTRGGSLGAGVK